MGIEQKFTEPRWVIAAVALTSGITFAPWNCSEPQRTRQDTTEQRQMMPDRDSTKSREYFLRHVFYDGPTITEYRSNGHDVEVPTIPPKRKDGRFYSEAIIPQSTRASPSQAFNRLPSSDPRARNDYTADSQMIMHTYARSGPRR